MSYIVLARRYRPQNFKEVVGQQHITDIIGQAIQSDRLSHAYLFCGPRGVGKTSCARILAKSLNCQKGPTLTPCGQCPACEEIAKSTSFDVIEIDGASNRGIDEIRTLRENVKFAPSYGRFKIYIVDEVHMLTSEAFNALLKTLEEPPAHVKFIFATTAPNKLPATIISRCQRFDFKRVPVKTTIDYLSQICQNEKFKIEESALYAIAKSAQGSLRDALGVLDQIGSLADHKILADDVFAMLGLVDTDLLFNLVDAIGQKDAIQTLKVLEDILDKGKDIKQLLRDLTEHFRHLMVIKVGGKAMGKLVDYPNAVKDIILQQCQYFSLDEILQALDQMVRVHDMARITENTRLPLEMALVQLSSGSAPAVPSSREPIVSQSDKHSLKPAAKGILHNEKGELDLQGSASSIKPDSEASVPLREDVAEKEHPVVLPPQDSSQSDNPQGSSAEEIFSDLEGREITVERIRKCWDALTFAVSRQKMSIATYLQEGGPVGFNDNCLAIGFTAEHKFYLESLQEPEYVRLVEKIFSSKLNTQIRIEFCLVEESSVPENDPDIKNILNTFNGKIVNQWHND